MGKFNTNLTQQRLLELVHYDPDSGLFTARAKRIHVSVGQTLGSLSNGYVVIRVDDILHRAHRLAWLYVTGSWPRTQIDHRDLDKRNNKWSNLREATPSANNANRPAQRNNTSGFKGVHWDNERGKWSAEIKMNGRRYYLGRFQSPEEASRAYQAAAVELCGDFARNNSGVQATVWRAV